jgi:outer membrane protein TolC
MRQVLRRLTWLCVSGCVAAPMLPVWGAEPITLPSGKDVEGLGAGWPAKQAKAFLDAPPIPVELLENLDMATAVRLANQRNPVVRQNFDDLLATQNSLGAAYATWWPVINVDLNGGLYGETAYYNYQGAVSGVGNPYGGTATAFNGSYFQSLSQFDITWNLFDPARTPSIWKNKYLVRQAVDSYVIARRDNRLRTQEAFIELQRSMARIQTGRELVSNDRLLLGLAQARVTLGVSSKLEIAKQTTVLKTDEVNLANSLIDSQVAQADLAALLSESRASSLRPSSQLAPLGSWTAGLDETIQAAMEYRKVIEQQLMNVKINQAQAQIDLSVYRPTLALVNSLYWTKGAGYTAVGPPWVANAQSDLWNGSSLLQLTFRGFDGGQARMTAEASMKRAKAAEAATLQAVNQVRRDVQTYYAQVSQGRKAVILASQRANAASSALRLQSLRFSAGYGTITDVVQAQQDLTQAVADYIAQLADYNVALVSLARSSGLTYEPDPQLEKQLGNPLSRLRLPSLTRPGVD